jgi:hypothetical protein
VCTYYSSAPLHTYTVYVGVGEREGVHAHHHTLSLQRCARRSTATRRWSQELLWVSSHIGPNSYYHLVQGMWGRGRERVRARCPPSPPPVYPCRGREGKGRSSAHAHALTLSLIPGTIASSCHRDPTSPDGAIPTTADKRDVRYIHHVHHHAHRCCTLSRGDGVRWCTGGMGRCIRACSLHLPPCVTEYYYVV